MSTTGNIMEPQRDDELISRSTGGFTLVEMLATLIVLTLLTGMVAMGVNLGLKTYRESTFASESQILMGTINSALSDPFRNMTYTEDEQGSRTYSIIYRDDVAGETVISPSLKAIDGQIYIQGTNTSGNGIALLNRRAYSDCKVTDIGLDNCNSTMVSGTFTIQSTVNADLKKENIPFSFVPINPIHKPVSS